MTIKLDGKTREQLVGLNYQYHDWVRERQEPYEDGMPGRQNWQAENQYLVFIVLDGRQCPIDDPQGYRDNERPLSEWLQEIAQLVSGEGARDGYRGLTRRPVTLGRRETFSWTVPCRVEQYGGGV